MVDEGGFKMRQMGGDHHDLLNPKKVLPGDDDHKIHGVPQVAHVAVLVQNEAVGQDFGQHFDGEDDHEDGL